MKLKTLLTTMLTTTLLAASTTTGWGQLLLNEDFDYGTTAGDLTTITTNWTGFSGTTPVGYIATSLSMASYQSSGIGGAATYNTANSEDVTRTFTAQSTGSLYASFLLNATNSSTTGTYFFTFRNNAGAFFGRLQSKQGSAPGKLIFGIGAGSTITFGTNEYDENTTYLVVVKFDFVDGATNDVASLYILTAPTNTIPTTPEATSTGATDPTELSAIAIRQASGCGTGTIDGIRVANTWQETAGIDMTAPVATFDPADAATGVSSSATPTITFDEPVFAIGGATITDPTSLITLNQTDATGTAVPFTATINGTNEIITVTPTSSLTPGQLYYLAIAPVQDAAGNATVAQSITFTTAVTLSTETDITGFTLAGVDGTIDATNHTVSVVLPYGTNVTALEPTITLSQGATVSPTGAQDFTNPVTYTVTAEDGATTQPWVATVTFSAPEFTATYPKSANIGKNQFDVVVNLMSAAKVYYMMLASGSTAPTSAEVKAANNVIDVTAAATDYPVTISGLDANTTYDVYFVTEDNGGTILMDTPVKLSVTTSAGTLSIHDVQYTTDPSGASTYNNNIVTLNGTVTAIKNTSAGAYSGFYMQDAAGAWNGIYVYTSTYTVTPGDNVSVTGTVVEYKSNNTYLSTLTEISSTSDVTIISSGNTLPEATLVSTLDANSEAYESVLVKVENATCTGNPSTGTFTVDDGTGVLNLYKALFPTLALTTGTVYNVTGIMTDYSNATIQMYELYPRDANDVTLATGIGQNSTEATQVFPNPFTSNFTVNSGKVVSTVSIYNLLGQKLMERSYSATEVTVPAANLTNGIYIVNVRFQDGSAATLRMVKK